MQVTTISHGQVSTGEPFPEPSHDLKIGEALRLEYNLHEDRESLDIYLQNEYGSYLAYGEVRPNGGMTRWNPVNEGSVNLIAEGEGLGGHMVFGLGSIEIDNFISTLQLSQYHQDEWHGIVFEQGWSSIDDHSAQVYSILCRHVHDHISEIYNAVKAQNRGWFSAFRFWQ